jgi:signal transduction histidine kinase
MEQVKQDINKNNKIIKSYLIVNNIPENIITDITQRDDMNVTIFNENESIAFTTHKSKSSVSFYNRLGSMDIISTPDGISMILNNEINSSQNEFYLQISKLLSEEYVYLNILFTILMAVDTLALFFIIIIGSRASKKMLLPVKRMTETVKEISIQDLDTRLDVGCSHDELKELAETFNDMIDRIQHSYEQQDQFVSDASHELRTPISVIQGYANLLYRWGKNDKEVLDESITAIKIEAENMKDLVEKLLFLARSDKNTQKVEKKEFIINELLEEIVKETKLIDSNHKITYEANTNNIIINADRRLIKQALRIFIDNSVKFTPANGLIKICAKTYQKQLILEIEDTGVGIPKEDIPYIFNRFYIADKSRTKQNGGNGLGLSIAQWIINKHNGTIQVQSTLNVGTKISIFLPV